MRSLGGRGTSDANRGGAVSGSESPTDDEDEENDEDDEVSSSVFSAERSRGV